MSSPSSHTYETVYILKPGVSDADALTIHQKVDNVIAKFQGTIKVRDDWGLQPLAYAIQNESTGRFSVVVYNGTSGVVEEIERHFKILDQVIRFLTVAVPADYDYAKAKLQAQTIEEEVKRNRELRKKGEFGGGGRDFGGGGRDFGGGGGRDFGGGGRDFGGGGGRDFGGGPSKGGDRF